jgi:hypothetical protein
MIGMGFGEDEFAFTCFFKTLCGGSICFYFWHFFILSDGSNIDGVNHRQIPAHAIYIDRYIKHE